MPILIVIAIAVIGLAIYRSSHAGGSSSSTPATIRAVTTSTVGSLVPPEPGDGSTDTTARTNSETRLLVVGDCVRKSTGDGYIGFDKASCDEPHDGEVAWVGAHPAPFGDAFPDAAAWAAFGRQVCGGDDGPVARWLGSHAQGDVSSSYLYPSVQGWSDGDRRVVCIAALADGPLQAGRQGTTST